MSDKDMIMISIFVFLPNIHATTKRSSDLYINIFSLRSLRKGFAKK